MASDHLKTITRGESLKLRDGALPHVKIRNWEFLEIDKNGIILLSHRGKGYTLEIKEDDIDWEDYQKNKEERGEVKRNLRPPTLCS
jgi:hypothetical protein